MERWDYVKNRLGVAWLSSSLPFALSVIAAWSVILSVTARFGLGPYLEHRVVSTLEFRVREALGQTPVLSPKIKVFAFDDKTAASLGDVRMQATEWARVLRSLAASQPRAIIVDGMFSTEPVAAPEVATALKSLGGVGTPLLLGAYVSRIPIPFRSKVAVADLNKNLGGLAPPVLAPNFEGANVYGPTPLFQAAFPNIGHVTQDWPTRFAPALRLSAQTAIPYVALLAANQLKIGADGVEVDGHKIAVDSEGLAPVDFLPPGTCYSRILPLSAAVEAADRGDPVPGISSGDLVLVINSLATGSVDVKESPFGPLPGSFVIMSVLNSVARGTWLASVPFAEFFLLFFAALGTAIGLFTANLAFWSWLAFGALGYFVLSLAAFAYGGTTMPWLVPLAGFVGAGITSQARQRFADSKRRAQLEHEVATASILQRQFFPPADCSDPRFALAAHYQPADAVGGDWYSYRVVSGRWLHVHVGDVTGHGTPAAMLASFAKGATDMFYDDAEKRGVEDVALADLHRRLNDIFRRERGELVLMTLFSVAIDLVTGACRYVNSGHRAAYVLRADGAAIGTLSRGGSTILGHGTLQEKLAAEPDAPLDGSETLLLISDGLLDVPASLGIKMNERALRKMVKRLKGYEAPAAREMIIRELGLANLGKSVAIPDDVTFIVLKLSFIAKNAATRGRGAA